MRWPTRGSNALRHATHCHAAVRAGELCGMAGRRRSEILGGRCRLRWLLSWVVKRSKSAEDAYHVGEVVPDDDLSFVSCGEHVAHRCDIVGQLAHGRRGFVDGIEAERVPRVCCTDR